MKLRTIALSVAILLGSAISSFAAIPWGSTGPLQQNSATPTCTYTATALSCINLMGANETSLTLAGMTAGNYYTMIFLQDGTGSRTLTQTAITGAPALTTAESAANGYAVWVIKATSASAASFVTDYPNLPLWKFFTGSQATAGSAVAPGASQAQATFVVPGMTTSDWCGCQPQVAVDATWATDFVRACTPFTNGVSCVIENPHATNTTTPSATTLNIRIMQ